MGRIKRKASQSLRGGAEFLFNDEIKLKAPRDRGRPSVKARQTRGSLSEVALLREILPAARQRLEPPPEIT